MNQSVRAIDKTKKWPWILGSEQGWMRGFEGRKEKEEMLWLKYNLKNKRASYTYFLCTIKFIYI